ncbi:hypothetical protein FD724_14870 [Nostoc sp. C057]|uniref:2-oxo acid dehydrogenase subunit E2 n=1 Tax=Nostoc sp. C057 TaxID=2576903 RepID=UPI0015C2CA2A|nr:2-oxo acid dehydrogenase subunit E2 [Nostoc sp. C057]QLE49253.1 hypothetical protein FD724_14870 [Nostoc sp. C057]
MYEIILPKFNNNDESYTLLYWLSDIGKPVNKEEAIAVFETSKAAFDLESEAEGILHTLPEAGDECKPGDVIGYLFETEVERQDFLKNSGKKAKTTDDKSLTITKVAQELIDKHGISEENIRKLGKNIIKRPDIEKLINEQSRDKVKGLEISRQQMAIARVVTQSHTQIPKAFLLMKIYSDAATQMLSYYGKKHDIIIGLPELLIKITATLLSEFPFFFGSLIDDNRFMPGEVANIGVTLDLGKGLFIPVIKNVGEISLADIANKLMDFRLKAMRGQFNEEELNQGNISLSINMDKDSLVTIPIILPSQSCMLSLGGIQEEVYLDSEQNVNNRSYINLGLAYDHRVINGREAAQFLTKIKTKIEQPSI